MNIVDSVYVSVPWFRLTSMDLTFKVLIYFSTYFKQCNRIKTELFVASGSNKQTQSNTAVPMVDIPKPRRFKDVRE